MTRITSLAPAALFIALLVPVGTLRTQTGVGVLKAAQASPDAVPAFQLDAAWPKPLPNNWMLGPVSSVAVDTHDHVWIVTRPKSLTAAAVESAKKVPAPPVIEFDADGNVVQAWGGSGNGYTWVEASDEPFPRGGGGAEHGIFVDYKDNVWIAGNGDVVLKFNHTGKLLLQIGQLWKTGGNTSTSLLGFTTDMAVDPQTNEVFVTDGYLNHRVIVFDADKGKYKRHWGAYGKKPDDSPVPIYDPKKPPPQNFFAVHGIRISNDGLVYVADRERDRVQVFRKDGTFVNEVFIANDVPAGLGLGGMGVGSASSVGFSPDAAQKYLYVSDQTNPKIWILTRSDLKVVGSVTTTRGTHHMAGADSKGNLYVATPGGGAAPQRYVPVGASITSSR